MDLSKMAKNIQPGKACFWFEVPLTIYLFFILWIKLKLKLKLYEIEMSDDNRKAAKQLEGGEERTYHLAVSFQNRCPPSQ